MSSYLDMYRQRIFYSGETSKDRIEHNLSKDFSQLLSSSPNKVVIYYQDNPYDCVLASGNSRVGTQTERKVIQYLMSARSLKLPEGATFITYDVDSVEVKHWLVLHREIHPYYGYYKYKVIELNYLIKYIDKNGVLKEIPVYINGTGEFDIKEYFRYVDNVAVELQNRALNLILPKNLDFEDGLRIIIGDEAWRYVDSDKISIPGVYYSTFQKTAIDNSSDIIKEEIADADLLGISTFVSNYGNSSVVIGLNTQDLNFFYLKNKEIKESDIVYSNFNKEIISYENNKLIPLKIGNTDITVTDKISNFSKLMNISIQESLNNYFHLIGDSKIATQESKVFKIFTDLEYDYKYDSEKIEIIKINNSNEFRIKAKEQIGNTIIHFYKLDNPDEKLFDFELSITSLWV